MPEPEPETVARRDDHEAELLERARRGDRRAFDGLVEAHLPRVWATVWRVVRHPQDAEDVVQDTFLTAWRGLEGFRGDASFSTWLHRIAVTRSLHHLDRASERLRRASRPLEDEREGGPALPAVHDSPLRRLESKELLARLTDCLKKLPAAWRAALALRDVDALSYEEIAKALDLALGTVRSRLARSRLALKQCVEEGA